MNPYLATIITLAIALSFLRIMDFFAHRGWIESKLSRKFIHIGTGPIFVLCWLMFPDLPISRYLAALVPLLITVQFALVGTGIMKDDAAVQAMTRTGNPREILRGPLFYGIVFVVLTVVYWKDSPIGITALMMMCGGDGIADIVGRLEPDAWEDEFAGTDQLQQAGFRPSPHALQPRRTIVLDLHGDEEEILSRMKQKTRYNIRLAARKEVAVEASDDLETFARLIEVTGERDAFGVHTPDYYRRAYELFHPSGTCQLFLASYQGQPLAGLMVFAVGDRAWYLYGASNNQQRNRMPTYLIQWEAIRWAKEKGCTSYDLWGVPDYPEDGLEENFSNRSDGLWGVYRFKRGFGGELLRACSAWDKVYHRAAYLGYQMLVARRGGA